MAITSLNMTLVSEKVFPSLITSIGPVLDSTVRVISDPAAKTVDVNIFAEQTGREFTQASASYTTDSASTTAVSVTTTEIYHIVKMNKLSFIQTPVDVVMACLPVIGRAIGNKMFAMQNALVLAATFTNTATTSTAANFDADDVADLATSLSTAKASKVGRYAVLPPNYYGALSKDSQIQSAYAFGDDGVIKRNLIPSVHGFSIHEVSDVAASADVAALEGWFAAPEAFAVAFRPSFESAEVPNYAQVGTYTEPTTGITMTTKIWDGMDGNFYIGGFVGFGIAAGQAPALTILKSA
jgi:hypothetical protein